MSKSNVIFYFLIVSLFINTACKSVDLLNTGKKDVLVYVDPLIGTDGHGHTHPAATLPFGMVQVGLTNKHKGWDWCSGYNYNDTVAQGFAHTHLSGTGLTGLGDILLMPTSGDLKLEPGTDENPDEGYSSRWSHKTEIATPGYYKVHLDDYNIDVELTCTKRVGFHRYTFNNKGLHHIIIDPTNKIYEQLFGSEIEILSDTEVRGFKHCNGAGGNRHVYFYAKFSKPFDKKGVAVDRKLIEGNIANAKVSNGYVAYNVNPGDIIEAKVAISFVDYEGAKKNYDAETTGKSFDNALAEAKAIWQKELSKVQVEDSEAPVELLRTFYTGLYHAMLHPNLISDVDLRYYVEGKVYQGKINQYSTYSTWDTFRAQHPLLTIINPEITSELVNSIISRHYESKVDIPIWELTGHDNACMQSYTPVSVVVDAIFKGIPGIDKEVAYAAIKSVSLNDEKRSAFARGLVVPWIKKLNYVPSNIWESCSHTIEYAYQDWCIYALAKELGKEDTTYYKKRSLSYLNLFRKDIGYIAPKDSLGNWIDIDLTNWESLRPHYITGNIWGYTTFVPHDIDNLIELKGGKEAFCNWLDEILADTSHIKGEAHVDISGFTGRYAHGDEPSHQIPYLYNYAGKPWKTQELVRHVMTEFYNDTPNGYCNNEDCGQMSAWYVMGALGLYDFCPGDNLYTLTSPLFKKVTINLDNGKKIIITGNNNPVEHKYIKSLSVNGEEYHTHLISHEKLIDDARLNYVLSNEPNTTWAAK